MSPVRVRLTTQAIINFFVCHYPVLAELARILAKLCRHITLNQYLTAADLALRYDGPPPGTM